MAFNVQKCYVMHIGRHNPKHEYKMNGEKLSVTENERDIGVIISNSLKQAEQCRKAAQTASAVLAQIQRAFHYRDRFTYVSLYKQYVRPHLEFATQAWAPWNQGDIDVLERVQERAVKAVSGLQGRSYHERLKELGLKSLVERREEADMVLTHKILNEGDSEYSEQWFKMAAQRPTRQGGGPHKMVEGRAGHNFRREFFSLRVPRAWNRLPTQVKEAGSTGAFKALYRRHIDQGGMERRQQNATN
jgi:hypothetical protein